MPIVCIQRPNRAERRNWSPGAVSRVARYAARDADAAQVAARVVYCLGFGPAVECCAAATVPPDVVQAGVSLRKTTEPLRKAVQRYLELERKLSPRLRRLLAPITAIIEAIGTALRLLDRVLDQLSPGGDCASHTAELSARAEQLAILRESEAELGVCDGPELAREEESGAEAGSPEG